MRILFISNFYPPHELGGMEQLCGETVDGLRARGNDCHVLTSRLGRNKTKVNEVGISRLLFTEADVYHYRPVDFFLARPVQDHFNQEILNKTLATFIPDIVYVWGMWNLSVKIAFHVERLMPGRVAYTIASYWPMEPDVHETYWQQQPARTWARMIWAPVQSIALRRLARERVVRPLELRQVACVSHHVKRRLVGAGVLPHGARVIYNGIDPAPFLDAASKRTDVSRPLRLVYLGGILPHKGVHTAVEALGWMKQMGSIDDINLTLIGRGHPSYETLLQNRIDELGLREHVTFHGWVPRKEIAQLLARFDICLFTSSWEEPIARTVMEAMASGLAVIGTDVGGQREILVDGVNSLVFAPGDFVDLAHCILRVKSDSHLRKRLAQAGQSTVVERFTLDRMIGEIEDWLQSLLA